VYCVVAIAEFPAKSVAVQVAVLAPLVEVSNPVIVIVGAYPELSVAWQEKSELVNESPT
jgi:hypothetical protein